MEDIKFYAYQAGGNDHLNNIYVQGHARVLKDYGVNMVTSSKPTWIDHDKTFCIIAVNNKNIMVGGIRIQLADWIRPLPMETAIGKMDAGIYDLVKKYKGIGVGELCGLWNSKQVAGLGVSFALTRAAVAYVPVLNFEILMGICAEYSLQMFRNVGFEIDRSLSNNGEFPYPTEDYITRVVGILKAMSLETAHPHDRKQILELRSNYNLMRIEEGKKGKFRAQYQLKNRVDDGCFSNNLLI